MNKLNLNLFFILVIIIFFNIPILSYKEITTIDLSNNYIAVEKNGVIEISRSNGKKILSINGKNPKIKEYSSGTLYLLCENIDYKSSSVSIYRIVNEKIISYELISEGFPGYNLSSYFILSRNQNPLITWVNYSEGIYRVYFFDLEQISTYLITKSSHQLSSPKLLEDMDGNIYIFWLSSTGKGDEICYTKFSYSNGAKINKLEQKFSQNNVTYQDLTPTLPTLINEPVLDFSCEKDDASKIWIAYTQYDGDDWEIYAKCFDEALTYQETHLKISSNSFQDRNAKLLNVNGEMFVIWEKISNGKTAISVKKLNSKQNELDIIPFQKEPIFFNAFASDGIIKILYSTKGRNNKLYIKNLNERYLSKTTLEDLIYDHETEESKSYEKFELINDPNEYIAFGDSITYGTFGDGFFPEKGYVPRLQNFLLQNLGSSTVLNRGIPGEDTIHGLSRIDAVLNGDKSGYFLLMEGTNDVTLGYSLDNIRFNLKEILKKCLNFGIRPLIASIIPKAFDYEYQNYLVIQLKEKIKGLSEELSIPFVDQFTAFYSYPDEYGGWRSLYSDRSHPNEKGYELMAKTWFESIKKLGPFPPSGLRVTSLTRNSSSITLRWNPNYDSDLHGYSLYVGFSSKKYIIRIPLGNITSYNISLLPGKTYYFSLKAIDTLNNESDFSEEISYKSPFWNYSNNN